MKFALCAALLASVLIASPAQAAPTCSEQSKICYRIGGNPGCLSKARIAECKRTCIWTGVDGRRWPSEGDCRRKGE